MAEDVFADCLLYFSKFFEGAETFFKKVSVNKNTLRNFSQGVDINMQYFTVLSQKAHIQALPLRHYIPDTK